MTSIVAEPSGPQFKLAMVGAASAVVTWGMAGILIVKIDMGGLAVGVYRFWIYALVLVVWMSQRGTRINLNLLRHTAPGGIALALDVALFFSAVKETTIVNVTVIAALQPIIVGAVAWRFFGERLRRRDILLAALALAATFIVVINGKSQPEWNIFGDILAVGSVIAWAAYFIFSKASRNVMSSGEYTLGTAIWTCVVTTLLALIFGQDLSWPTTTNWAWLIALALSAGVFGHVVMNWAITRIPLWISSTLTLLIPVCSAIFAWIILDQKMTMTQIAAIAVVLTALALIINGQKLQLKAQPVNQ